MARVLVVHPAVSVARDFIDYPYLADLGAVQLAAALRARGHGVALVDAFALARSTLAWRPDGRAHLGAPVPDVVAATEGAAPDAIVVAYTPFHRPPTRDDVLAATLAGLRAAHPAAPIALADCYQSGQHYVESPGDAVLASYPEAALWVKYEAEHTLPALVDGLARGTLPREAVRGEDVPSLDDLPLPAWDLVDLAAYARFHARVVARLGRGPWAFPIDGRTLPLVTSRGCPYVCVHCSSNPGRAAGSAKTQRRYGPEKLRSYVHELVRTHGATRLAVLDEMVNVNERHFETLLDAVEETAARFDVPNGMRADHLRRRHLARMKGRVATVSVSAESGSPRVVAEVVAKRLDLAAIDRVAEDAKAEGVALMVHFMIGLPGETAEEVNATLAYALGLYERTGAWPAVQYATPLPGTELARGRALPVVDDWGPRFQTAPSADPRAVDPDALRRFKETFDARMAAEREPLKVIMNVTYVCNNHCTFCAVGTRTQVDGHPTRQREHLEKYRAQGVTLLDIDGGEPTLNPELVALVRHARAIGYERVNVTTNGRLCAYEGYARKLARSGVTSLLFSVHGPDAQTHAQQVGVAEAFDQTVQGIRNCRAHAPPGVELGMNITLTKGNYKKLDAVAALAWELGLRWLNVQFLTPFGRATRWVAPDTADAAAVTRDVIDRWHDRMKLQVINLPWCFLPGYERFVAGDLLKLRRRMVFVNNEDVNLGDYLAERRTHRDVCRTCPHAVFCGGFYEMDDVPEPPWLVRPEDLLRPVAR